MEQLKWSLQIEKWAQTRGTAKNSQSVQSEGSFGQQPKEAWKDKERYEYGEIYKLILPLRNGNV